jgi:hypothetical protein
LEGLDEMVLLANKRPARYIQPKTETRNCKDGTRCVLLILIYNRKGWMTRDSIGARTEQQAERGLLRRWVFDCIMVLLLLLILLPRHTTTTRDFF